MYGTRASTISKKLRTEFRGRILEVSVGVILSLGICFSFLDFSHLKTTTDVVAASELTLTTPETNKMAHSLSHCHCADDFVSEQHGEE